MTRVLPPVRSAKTFYDEARGFTLIEMLVAAAVMILLLTLALSAITTSSTVMQKSQRTMAAMSDARFALDGIGSDLNARLRRIDLPFLAESLAGNDKLLFFSTVPSSSPSGSDARGIALVAYMVNSSSAGQPYELLRASSGVSWSAASSLPFADPNLTQTIASPDASLFDTASDSVFRMEVSLVFGDGSVAPPVSMTPANFKKQVSAVVVTVAALDPEARKKLLDPYGTITKLIAAFPDATTELPAKEWIKKVNNLDSLAGETGAPLDVLSSIRISQRTFYVR